MTQQHITGFATYELKLGKFIPAHKGQMELYLRWLDQNERRKGEGKPLGIVLCTQKDGEQIELLELGKSGIHVAEYITALPPREILQKRLHEAIEIGREFYTKSQKALVSKKINSGSSANLSESNYKFW